MTIERSIRNCPVMVVGGAGFLGSHLVDHLVEERVCDVLVVDNLVVGRRNFVHPRAKFAHHDITGSEDYLLRLILKHHADYVFNMAAYPYIPDSFDRPLHVSNVNYFGAMKVINAARMAGVEGILQVSSAEIYGEGQPKGWDKEGHPYGAIDEGAPVAPHSTYGASKAAVDYFCQVRWREARTPVIALRQFNCVGERETHPYVVPEIMGQLSKQIEYQFTCPKCGDKWSRTWGDKICPTPYCRTPVPSAPIPTVRLGNNSFRDFMYAGDQARLAVELLEKGQFGEVYNLGSESGVKIYDLAKLIGKVMGFEDVKVEPDPTRVRPWEIWMLLADNTKIYSVIEGRPTVSLEEALRRTVEYFKDNDYKWAWEKCGG